MALKRNLNVFIKEKSTITALSFLLSFLLAFSLTFIPQLSFKKGISDTFENYKITHLSSNNYSVVYAASDNYLFFSQHKKQTSSLNAFAGIEDYSNEYGSATSHYYNYIKIDYRFSDKIIDVQGISDDMLGKGGETFVLTQNNYLYTISERSKTVDLLSRDIKQISVKRDYKNRKNIYLLLDTKNNLYKCYFENHIFYKEKIIQREIEQFYYIDSKENVERYVFVDDNKVYLLSFDNVSKSFKDDIGINYETKVCDVSLNGIIKDCNLEVNKLLNIDDDYYVLKDNKVYTYDLLDSKELSPIECKEDIIDVYTTGENALIAKSNNKAYYYGNLKFFESKKFEELDVNGNIQGSRNALFVLDDKGYIKMYNKESKQFDVMYQRVILNKIFKYGSLFVVGMIIIYLFVSFLELNERYNRYFSVNSK